MQLMDAELTALGSKRDGRREEFNNTYTHVALIRRNKWQPVIHPSPLDKYDSRCHSAPPECTAERSAFRKGPNDLGDIGDSGGDVLSHF